MKIVGEKEAYEELANAIVVTAVQDYKHALVRLKRHPESESAKRDVERLEKFFFSEWYELLTNLDPSYLIRKLKEAIDEKYGGNGGKNR